MEILKVGISKSEEKTARTYLPRVRSLQFSKFLATGKIPPGKEGVGRLIFKT